jgi:DNA-binding CsgD family transcriptional regulator
VARSIPEALRYPAGGSGGHDAMNHELEPQHAHRGEADRSLAIGEAQLLLLSMGGLAPESVGASIRSRIHLAAGRLDEAAATAAAGCAEANAWSPLALSTLATVAIRRGDLAEAARHVARSRSRIAGSPAAVRLRVRWTAGQLTEARQGPAAAMEALAEVYDSAPACRHLLLRESAAAGWLVRTALAAGDLRRARTVTFEAEQIARHNPSYSAVVAAAAHARGLLAGAAGPLRRAAADHPDPWARASAAEDLGRLIAQQGEDHPEAAVRAWEEAASGYERHGAQRDAARVRGRLRRLGVSQVSAKRTARPASGWNSLTEVELAVADRVAEGLTNRQVAARMFLSPHTIAFHLRHIFRKLGISSRMELARLSVQRDRR